jgi:RNA polymerase sigma factor (sigma-70 family)
VVFYPDVARLLVTSFLFYDSYTTYNKKRAICMAHHDDDNIYTPDWFEKAKAKDEEGLTVFYNLYKKELFAYIIRRISRYEDAEDLLIIIFEKICINFHKIFSIMALRPYMYRVAHNAVTEYYRKKKTKYQCEHINCEEVCLESHYGNPGEALEKKEEIALLRDAMLRLPAREFEVLKLFYDQKKSTKEIAAMMGKTTRSVESILYRGRKRLGNILEKIEEHHSLLDDIEGEGSI